MQPCWRPAWGLNETATGLSRLAALDEPNEELVLEELVPIGALLGRSNQAMLEQLGLVTSVRDLKELFELPLDDLNTAIKTIGLEFRSISNEVQHRRQLKAYLSEKFDLLMEQLRTHFVDKFDRGEALSEYVRLREILLDISPDSSWFEKFEDLPAEVVQAHVQTWLTTQGLTQTESQSNLLTSRECRTTNADRLRSFWSSMGPVLSAWVRQGGQGVTPALREVWMARGQAPVSLRVLDRTVKLEVREISGRRSSIYLPKDKSKTYPVLMQRTCYSVGPYFLVRLR